jgi:hypothetical protein
MRLLKGRLLNSGIIGSAGQRGPERFTTMITEDGHDISKAMAIHCQPPHSSRKRVMGGTQAEGVACADKSEPPNGESTGG